MSPYADPPALEVSTSQHTQTSQPNPQPGEAGQEPSQLTSLETCPTAPGCPPDQRRKHIYEAGETEGKKQASVNICPRMYLPLAVGSL